MREKWENWLTASTGNDCRGNQKSFRLLPRVEIQSAKPAYSDEPGFCKSVKLEEISSHGYVLTPGRYVGAADVEDDGEAFDQKMKRLTATLEEQFTESAKLEKRIRASLAGLTHE